jgi:AGZA family xanthine/uracil permease-like MFS transporter
MAIEETSTQGVVDTPGRGALDRFFSISERGSTVSRELRGGLVTFFTMAYIVVLNPLIIGTQKDSTGQFLGGGGVDAAQTKVVAATALVAGVMTLLMGVVANYPLALATGLGLNAFVAFGIAQLPGMTWADAMGLVVLEGLVILVLVATGLRTAVFHAVPASLRTAISVGIGLFITLIGLVDAGVVRRTGVHRRAADGLSTTGAGRDRGVADRDPGRDGAGDRGGGRVQGGPERVAGREGEPDRVGPERSPAP